MNSDHPVRGAGQVLLAILVAMALTSLAQAEKPPRYSALLMGGQRVSGAVLADWHDKNALPRLDAQPLLDPANPVRWLRDRSLPLPQLPVAYVETHTGDRLPGQVVNFRTGREQPFTPLPPHLLIAPTQDLEPIRKAETPEIRVVLSSLRRVVWQRRSRQPYQPATAFFRDGRSINYRAIRFGSGFVSLLLDNENRKVPWSDLAEVHLPVTDFWTAYFDELATLCSTPESRLMQLETSAGLVATTSLDRFIPAFTGNPQDSGAWIHGVQPAWSLDVLWVPCRGICTRRFFRTYEVPLSRVPFELSSGKTALVNQSILGNGLRNTPLDFGWGFGVQAPVELKFELPVGVKTVRSQVGLDRASGKGGCVRARLFANASTTPPLWESPFIVGADAAVDTGILALGGPAAGQKHLVLQMDSAHEGRPAGSDPLDIRDQADWFDPLMELDPLVVKAEIDRRLHQRFFAWNSAEVRLDSSAAASVDSTLEIMQTFSDQQPMPGGFATAVGPKGKAVLVSRKFRLAPQDQWLIIAASRPINRGPEPKLEVRIGSEPVAEYIVPLAAGDLNDVRPLAISLAGYQEKKGAEIDVEVRHIVGADSPPIYWRTLEVSPQLPTLFTVLEDQARFAPHPSGSVGNATLVEDSPHYGRFSARLAAGSRQQIRFPQPVAIRERPKWGEYRFLRFVVRKKGGGRLGLDLETTPPRRDLAGYDAGVGDKIHPTAIRVLTDKLPDQWMVVTRDLFADFGALDLTAMTLRVPDGESAGFDHIYLARTQDEYNLIPAAPSPEQTNQKARQELAQQIVDKAQPAMVAVEFADGRFIGGVLVRKEGDILTAGHLLRGANQDVTVHLADGRKAKAKTLGVSRELDLGLVKISDMGQWPPEVPIWNQPTVAPGESYVALTFPAKLAAGVKPAVQITDLRRFFRTTLWMDIDQPAFTPGGALLNKQGMLVGIHLRRSQFGGFLFTRLHAPDLQPHLDRMLRAETFGAWPAGSEPQLDIAGKGTLEGWELTTVDAAGAGGKAGLKVGDKVVRIDGKPVVGPDDVQFAVAEKDAGQEIVLDLMRAGVAQQLKVVLAPRMP